MHAEADQLSTTGRPIEDAVGLHGLARSAEPSVPIEFHEHIDWIVFLVASLPARLVTGSSPSAVVTQAGEICGGPTIIM